MGRRNAKGSRAVLAAMALMLALSPAAVADAAPSKSAMVKQIKALKQQTAALTSLASALQAKIASLEANQPVSLPPIERAGGDLVGLYPNPQLRTGAVVGNDIADGTIFGRHVATETLSGFNILDDSIDSADIGDGSIGQAELGAFSVGANQLTDAFVVKSFPNPVGGNNASGSQSASCPPFTRMLSGGAEWAVPRDNLIITMSGPSQAAPNTTWEVVGQNNSGVTSNLFAKVLCLKVRAGE